MAFSDKIQDIQDQISSIEWDNVRPDNYGSWPIMVKVLAWVGALVVVVGSGYYFLIQDLQGKEQQVEQEEVRLRADYTKKAFDAANLQVYRDQMEEMSESFNAMISQLPSETEVPGLLEDITAKGVSSGLVFESINLETEQRKEFYVQLPISIKAEGTYHDMGAFVGGVAGLPRIVTLTDFTIEPMAQEQRNSSKLKIQVLAHTYRYNDKAGENQKSSRKKGKRK